MRFQVAQKLHAVSDPHEPPDSVNDRARDIVDLLLLRDLITDTGRPTLTEVRSAGIAVFEARAAEAVELGLPPRVWPPTIVPHSHWMDDYARAAASGHVDLPLDEAVARLNAWIATVANS